jgi:putative membrane protein
MLELIFALLLGIAAGILTGILPGLHTNTVAVILVTATPALSAYFPLTSLAVFLVSMIICSSFVDFIPSIFLGAPEEDTVLGVLPGHEMLLRGEGYRALKLTIVGGVGALLVGLCLFPLFFLFIKFFNPYFEFVIAPILIIFSAIFILTEKDMKGRFWAFTVFMLSGLLGMLVLNYSDINEPLFPMLSGFFGISTLLISMSGIVAVKKQNLAADVEVFSFRRLISYLKACLSSAFVSTFPGIGSAQAAVIAQGLSKTLNLLKQGVFDHTKNGSPFFSVSKFKDSEEWLVIVGGINTVAGIFTLGMLFLTNKARSGVMAAVRQIVTVDHNLFFILLATMFAAVGLSVLVTIFIGKQFARNIENVKYKNLSIGIIIFIFCLAAIFSGLLGVFICSVATAIGILSQKVGIRRIHCMGCLILPVLFYFM